MRHYVKYSCTVYKNILEPQSEDKAMIRDLYHVSISTKNFDNMLHFYRDLIGLPFSISYDWEPGNQPADLVGSLKNSSVRTAVLRAGNASVEIFRY